MHGPIRDPNLVQSFICNTLPIPAHIGQQPRGYNPQDGLQIGLAKAALLRGTAAPFAWIPWLNLILGQTRPGNSLRHKDLDYGQVKVKDTESAWIGSNIQGACVSPGM